jgi:hypothetical protein
MAVPKLKRQSLMLALKQQEVSKIITIGRGTAVAKKFNRRYSDMGGDTPPGESSNTAIQCRRLSAAHC